MLKSQTLLSFVSYQRKMDHSVNIQMFDNSNHFLTSLEGKDHVKYLLVSCWTVIGAGNTTLTM